MGGIKLFASMFVFLFLLPATLSVDLSDCPQFLLNDIYTVVGADASVLDLAAATDIVANIKSEYPAANVETKLDNELVNPYSVYRNLMLIGNSCHNEFVAMLMGKAFPSCDTATGIPENSAVIKIYEDGFVHGYDVILVAGWNETYTRIAASVLQKHDQLLSGMSEKAVKVTSATLFGITEFSEEEFVTTVLTTTTTTSTTLFVTSTSMPLEIPTGIPRTSAVSGDNEMTLPKPFYVYSLILIILIVGVSIIAMVLSRKKEPVHNFNSL